MLFEAADDNGDGRLDRQEFQDILEDPIVSWRGREQQCAAAVSFKVCVESVVSTATHGALICPLHASTRFTSSSTPEVARWLSAMGFDTSVMGSDDPRLQMKAGATARLLLRYLELSFTARATPTVWIHGQLRSLRTFLTSFAPMTRATSVRRTRESNCFSQVKTAGEGSGDEHTWQPKSALEGARVLPLP